MHMERIRKYGDPQTNLHTRPLWDRVWEKVDPDGDCWLWTAAHNHLGYGQIWDSDAWRVVMAHRAVYELLVGPIPVGLELDHLCRVHGCVNPDHLDPVTHRENIRRGAPAAAEFQRAKTHCPHGHPYDQENTYVNPKGSRECLACRKIRRRSSATSSLGVSG